MHKGKKLEQFIAKLFRAMPNVYHVVENGFGWKTDHGADLIVGMSTTIAELEFTSRMIVQVKSFEGEHLDVSAVAQVAEGIKKYDGDGGMIITTAKTTEQLEDEITEISDKIGKPINLLAHTELAKFIIKHAPEIMFRMDGIA